jgi:sugar lactone lactonase YvrE
MLFAAHVLAQSVQTPLLPTGVAYDSAGNLYFADTNRHQVYESTLAGVLVVVAGSGVQGFSGDGGAATSAELDSPRAVAVGSNGTLYIADTGNQRIRAVSAGQITTFAGNGVAGYGGDNGTATSASLNQPNALAIDASGALLVCDSANHRVRRVSNGVITTVAGNGVQGFTGDGAAATAAELDTPSGIAVRSDGSIFLADTGNNRLRAVSAAGTISTFAGTGSYGYSGDGAAATAAQLALPQGVAISSAGLVVFADSNNQRIRMVDASGNISTIAGTGLQGSSADASATLSAEIDSPSGMSVSSFGSPVFADSPNQSVRELLSNGKLYLPAGLAPTRSSSATLNVAANPTYGQTSASVSVTGSAGTPQGEAQLLNGASPVAQGPLVAGTVTFSSVPLLPGTYSLSADYEGDGVNPAAMSSASPVVVAAAPTVTTEQPLAQNSYAGLPLVITANVAATTTSGVPTGTVQFLDGGSVVATAQLANGVATGTYLSPTAGQHSIVADYGGNTTFAASSSAAVTTTVAATPDFTLASVGSSSQTVQAGNIAVYTFSITAQPAPFTGTVDMSVSGLPKGYTATFAPPQVVPGTGSAIVVLSIQTPAMGMLRRPDSMRDVVLCLFMLPIWVWRKKRSIQRHTLVIAFHLVGLCALVGCGDRSLSSASQGSHSYSMSVSGTGTSLTGSVLVHTTPITLIVQ